MVKIVGMWLTHQIRTNNKNVLTDKIQRFKGSSSFRKVALCGILIYEYGHGQKCLYMDCNTGSVMY